jgi:hypothetical protein
VTVEADDNPNRCIEVADRGVAFQPALNLTLGPLTPGRPAKVANGLFDEPSLREPASAVAVPLVEQQTGPVVAPVPGPRTTAVSAVSRAWRHRCRRCRHGTSRRRHTSKTVEEGGRVEPAPAYDRQVGEVGLPQLVPLGGLGMEFLDHRDDVEGSSSDRVMHPEQAIDEGFGDKVAFLTSKPHYEFAQR